MGHPVTPTAEFLARRFMQSVDLPGMTESTDKLISLVLDPGLPHKPRELNDLRIHTLTVLDPLRLKTLPKTPCESLLMVSLNPCVAELYIYLQKDGSAVAEVKEYGKPTPEYRHAKITFNNTDLGWFKKPN